MSNKIITLLFIGFYINFNAQKIIYEDYFFGGVVGTGINIGTGGYSPVPLDDFLPIYIEPGSEIRNVFLISNYNHVPASATLVLNENPIELNPFVDDNISFIHLASSGFPIRNYSSEIKDITSDFYLDGTALSLITPSTIPFNNNPAYTGFYFIILYENLSLPLTNVTIVQNITDSSPSINYSLTDLNPIDISKEVGLSVSTSNCCNLDGDGCIIYVNENYTGILGLDDPLGLLDCSSIGNFYYQNNTLYGLSDDTADTLFYATDAIANIQPYLNSTTSLNITYEYQDSVNGNTPFFAYTNTIWQTFLTYSTPCDTFSASVIDNQEICLGESVQLSAEGGVSYEWLPQEGLSCYDCPNPVFNDTTSHWFTVKINNNDSCHKILPVYVRVSLPPDIPFYIIEPVLCSDSTSGVLTVVDPKQDFIYLLDDNLPSQDSVFTNLMAVEHLLEITSNYGCKSDTTLTINTINPTEALFTASPSQGEIPLTVQFNNESQNATDYIWQIGTDTLYSFSPTFIFEEAGAFPITLIAYDTYPWCSHSTNFTIVAEPSFNVIIPSVYDVTGSPYQLFTSDVRELDYTLFNISGQQIYHTHLFPVNGSLPIWQKNLMATGIYLYRIKAVSESGEEKVFEGKVLVFE